MTTVIIGLVLLWMLHKAHKHRHHLRRRLDPFLRRQVLSRCCTARGYRCRYCHRCSRSRVFDPDGRVWQIDHIIPVHYGGKSVMRNLTLSCARCNRRKSDRMVIGRVML